MEDMYVKERNEMCGVGHAHKLPTLGYKRKRGGTNLTTTEQTTQRPDVLRRPITADGVRLE